jgi:hypothetical protein
VGLGIVGLNLYGVFGAEIGGAQIAPAFVEFSDGEVLGDSIFRGLNFFDLRELPAGGSGAGGLIGPWHGRGWSIGVGATGVVTGTARTAAGTGGV